MQESLIVYSLEGEKGIEKYNDSSRISNFVVCRKLVFINHLVKAFIFHLPAKVSIDETSSKRLHLLRGTQFYVIFSWSTELRIFTV